MDGTLLASIRVLVSDLAAGRYEEIEADGRAGRLSAEILRTAVSEYGRTLVPLPDEAIPLIDEIQILADPSVSAIDVPLWTIEEGRSDLTLQLESKREQSGYRLELMDLHVL